MTPDLDELRARAARHQDELDRDTRFLTVADLARRWRCSTTTVRAISHTALPYLNLGHGLVKVVRRYRLADVEAYELSRVERAG